MSARRVGILGGTFDPVHIGHLVTAVEVRWAAGLDVVLLVVANEPWQKVGSRPLTPAADRLAVVAAAVEGVSGVQASSLEIDRGGPTYTADTLAELAGDELFLIVGADVAAELSTWKRVDEIQASLAGLLIVGRPGFAAASEMVDGLAAAGWPGVVAVDVPSLEVSSTDVRRRVAEGRPVDFLLPPGAIHEIAQRGLYARA